MRSLFDELNLNSQDPCSIGIWLNPEAGRMSSIREQGIGDAKVPVERNIQSSLEQGTNFLSMFPSSSNSLVFRGSFAYPLACTRPFGLPLWMTASKKERWPPATLDFFI